MYQPYLRAADKLSLVRNRAFPSLAACGCSYCFVVTDLGCEENLHKAPVQSLAVLLGKPLVYRDVLHAKISGLGATAGLRLAPEHSTPQVFTPPHAGYLVYFPIRMLVCLQQEIKRSKTY